jgi:ubiquinone biosynthesis protein COQ4
MRDIRTEFVLWFARTINPQVQPDRPVTINLETSRQLPDGTLGREVARFIDDNNFTPITDGDLVQRTHDIWHVLTGLSPSAEDEFVLQAFTRAQVFRPSSALLVLYGVLTRRVPIRRAIDSLKQGRQAERLVEWNLEADWEKPLEEVRRNLGICPAAIKKEAELNALPPEEIALEQLSG